MTPHFLHEADQEAWEAAHWYEAQSENLGQDFLTEVERAGKDAAAEPLANPEIKNGFRKINLHRFPYALIYEVALENIIVHAVMHLHRKPDYWQNRR